MPQLNTGWASHSTARVWSPFSVNASESRIEAYKWLQLLDNRSYRVPTLGPADRIIHMTHEEVAHGNRRAADFVAGAPGAIQRTLR